VKVNLTDTNCYVFDSHCMYSKLVIHSKLRVGRGENGENGGEWEGGDKGKKKDIVWIDALCGGDCA